MVDVESSPTYDIITFSPDDPEDPKNWSTPKKRRVMGLTCLLAFCAVFGSSSYAPGEMQIQQLYGVNADVASSGLTVYVLGFAFAPLICPMSEMYGRRLPYRISWALMFASIIPSAFVENIVVILLFRFFTGCCAACALNNGVGLIADLHSHDIHKLSTAVAWFSSCALSGPCYGSLVGFFVAEHSGRSLWVVRVHWFFVIAIWPFVYLLPETYGPTILEQRAKKLRKEGLANARAPHEVHHKTAAQLLHGHVFRPVQMIFTEPIVQGAALWISIAYGIIYFFFETYPVVFIEQHDIPFQLCGLLFLGISIGMMCAVVPFRFLSNIASRVPLPGIEKKDVNPNSPESRLKLVLSGCILLPVSLFWFAWTSGPETYWLAAAFAGVPFGFSTIILFLSFNAYASHTYSLYASSAGAANTLVRSIIASILPIAAHSILGNLGTKWGVSLFGFLSLGLIPIPLIFIRYGAGLRERSHFAKEARQVIALMRDQKPQKEKDVSQVETQVGTDGDLKE